MISRLLTLLLLLLPLLGSSAPVWAQSTFPDDPPSVQGRVFDSVSTAPVEGATVTLVWPAPEGSGEPRKEVRTTNAWGEFAFTEVPAGTYTVRYEKAGYRPSTMTSFVVQEGQENRADFPLPPAATAEPGAAPGVEEFVVIASPLEEILAASRMESDELINTMSAEEISKFAASDVADALRFVPGVNVVKGQFAIIRGLEDRYSSTLYNSAPVPSPDPDSQSVQLDLFPSDIVGNLVVAKTFAAEQPSNSSGGSIDILTHEFPEETSIKLSAGSGFNDRAFDRFLEFQDDNPVGKEADNSDVLEDELGASIAGRREIGPRELRFKALLNHEVDFDTGEGFQEGREPAPPQTEFGNPPPIVVPGNLNGGLLGLSAGRYDLTESEYTEQNTSYLGLGMDLDSEGEHRVDLSAFFTRKENQIVQLRENGVLPSFPYSRLQTLDAQGREIQDTEFEGYATFDSVLRRIRPTREDTPTRGPAWFDSFFNSASFERDRDLLVYQMNADHRPSPLEGLHVSWAANYASTNQDEEAFGARMFYEPVDPTDLSIPGQIPTTPENLGPGTYFSSADIFENRNDITEDQGFGRFDAEYEADLSDSVEVTVSAGGWYEHADRDVRSTFLETPFVDSAVFVIPGATAGEAGGKISNTLARNENGTYAGSRLSSNDALREITAFNFGGKATLFEDIDLLAGLRREEIHIESNNDPYTGEAAFDGSPQIFPSKYVFFDRLDNPGREFIPPQPPGARYNDQILGIVLPVNPSTGFVDLVTRGDIDSLVNGEIDERKALPSYAIAYRPIEGLALRGAFSRTVARPSFREMGYYVSVEPATDDLVVGNPQLVLSDVESWDFRTEYFWGEGNLAAVSLFAKQIDKPIESITVRDALNTEGSSSALYRTFFNNPNQARVRGAEFEARKSLDFLAIEFLEYLSLGGNFTWIDAEVERTEAELARSTRFFGVPTDSPARINRMSHDRRLFGQPEYIANADVTFNHPDWGTKITLAYFQISDILDAAGTANINPDGRIQSFTLDRYIDEYNRVDLILSQKRRVEMFGGDLVFKASVKNLTDSKRRIIYDPEQTAGTIVERELRIGRDFSFSIGAEVPF